MSNRNEIDKAFGYEPENVDESPYLACLIALPDGSYCPAEVVDITDSGIIFEVNELYVRSGHFTECYVDSRFLKYKYFIIPHGAPTEH